MRSSPTNLASFSSGGAAIRHYILLTVYWILASWAAIIATFILACLFVYGYFDRLAVVLAIVGACLIAALLGVVRYAYFKKPPTLTSDDARALGCRFGLVCVFVTFISLCGIFGSTLFREHHDSLLLSLLGSAVGLTGFWLAPAYWFWRAKSLTPEP